MLEDNLFKHGYNGEVIVGVPKFDAYTYIYHIAKTASTYKSRIHFTVDQEKNNIIKVITKLQYSYNRNVVYGSGISACWFDPLSDTTRKLAAINKGAGVIGMAYTWTIDKRSKLEKAAHYFNGIITNKPGVLYDIIKNKLHITLAGPRARIHPASRTSIIKSTSGFTCDCDYHKGGCTISKAPQTGIILFCFDKWHLATQRNCFYNYARESYCQILDTVIFLYSNWI